MGSICCGKFTPRSMNSPVTPGPIAEPKTISAAATALLDPTCAPDGTAYIIPGNDDAARAISLYCDLASRAALDGMTAQLGAAGVDMGELEEAPVEEIVEETAEA